ncbi:MAG TPA: DUF4230 domain-containing protein [Chloroflexi bacterium]|nr:DUF4230 domain-containing protein [Chloroflexota bacterium]
MQKAYVALIACVALVIVIASWAVAASFTRALEPVGELRAQVSTQVAALLHPTPTLLSDPVTIVHEVRSLARLETMQYNVEKVITAETGQRPFGDRLLLVAHSTVIAGVDLDKLGLDDVQVDRQGQVTLSLPKAEIFLTAIDNEQTYVYDREVGLLRKGDVRLESAARLAAERAMEQSALNDGILEKAQANAESFLYRLLRDLGFSDVRFTVSPD